MPKVYQRAAARRDLVDHFVYMAENAGLDAAERFLTRAEATFDDLAGQPRMGSPLNPQAFRTGGPSQMAGQGLRQLHDLLHAPPDGVSIVRVLHAASDWWGLLGFDA